MELEELTKTQIILLVLLVSFVTSIATGIVTVSLLAQAPPAVTQTVNHIIQRTVETVAPANGQAASVITKETTVVVKEDDLVTKSVADAFTRIGRVHETAASTSPVIAMGAVIDNGMLITDIAVAPGLHAVTFGDALFSYSVSSTYDDVGIALMTATGTSPNLTPFKATDVGSLKLGQTVIGLYGSETNRIAVGTVSGSSALVTVKLKDASVPVRSIDTGLEAVTPGAPLISAFGDLAGISTGVSRANARGSFVAMSDIEAVLAPTPKATSTPTR